MSVSTGEHFKNVYKCMLFPVFVSDQKKTKKWNLCQITFNLSMSVRLFSNYSQTIGPKGLKFFRI